MRKKRLGHIGVMVMAAMVMQTAGTAAGSLNAKMQEQAADAQLKNGKAGLAIEMMSDAEGVDFNSYLHTTYLTIKKIWYADMPSSIESGKQGSNTVQFRVARDGKVPRESVNLLNPSGEKGYDEASLRAIRVAGPFEHLPEKYSQPSIVLRLTFYYNLEPKRN